MWGVEIATGATIYTLVLALPCVAVILVGAVYGVWAAITDLINYWPTWRILHSVPRSGL